MDKGKEICVERIDTVWTRTAKSLLSGTLGGIAVCFVGHPFDTLKVRLQTQPVKTPMYNGFWDAILKTIKWEGIGGFYQGIGSPLVGQMFFKSTMFLSYNQCLSFLEPEQRKLPVVSNCYIAGMCTGAVVSFVESPIDLLKTKMQCQIIGGVCENTTQFRNVFHAGAVIGSRYGVSGIYQGLPATLIRNIPSVGLFLGTFEYLKQAMLPPGGSPKDLTFPRLLAAGGAAGFCYWGITYPADVIKSAMQSDRLDKSERDYKGIFDCCKKLYEEDGWRRFYRGYTPCVIRSFIANATLLTVIEVCRRFMTQVDCYIPAE